MDEDFWEELFVKIKSTGLMTNMYELSEIDGYVIWGSSRFLNDVKAVYISDQMGKILKLVCEDKGIILAIDAEHLQELIDTAENNR